MCFDYGFGPFRWFVLQETGGFTKNRYHRLPSTRRNGKTAPIEIQQQMQDNIQWIKVRRKIN
jgi:urocanate hydratase